MQTTHVLKFGGTSLRNAALINQAADIISRRNGGIRPVVVVSAVGGVTNRLLRLAEHTKSDEKDGRAIIDQLKSQHLKLLNELDAPEHQTYEQSLESLFDELHTAFIDREKRVNIPGAWHDRLLSFGERASILLLDAALNARKISVKRLESQHFVKTDDAFGQANVFSDETRNRIQQTLHSIKEVPVITGFIGSTKFGAITTLGRSGSDYTASLVAGALCADLLEIWTDVDGVLTADPKIVPKAQSIDTLSYDDIAELSAHGARVLHPKTIDPLRNCEIPVRVRNSLNPEHPGTQIRETFSANGNFRSVTIIGPLVLIETPARHQSSFQGWLEEQLHAEQKSEIGNISVSAAETAQFLIPTHLYESINPQQWLNKMGWDAKIFDDLYQVKKLSNTLLQNDDEIARILQALARKQIHPLRWHRGRNRRHVSLLLPKDDARRAANLINDMMINPTKTIDLFIAGTGAVGGTLIAQLQNLKNHGINLTGTCNTQKVQWFTSSGETREQQSTDWPSIIQTLTSPRNRSLIFVDATGSEQVARLYPDLFEAGVHIVTPSKLANTFEQSYYNKMRETAAENNAQFRYEPTVGAGLPVLSTINDLLQTGDTITEISGVVSGTMTYLFNQLESGVPFSKAIVDAREKGYAEPDPRDDLSGEDVARKFLTLAREIGLEIEREELQVDSLIPEELASLSRDDFLERLPEFDQSWIDKLKKARENDHTLRYTGRLVNGEITIDVQKVPQRSPLGNLKGSDNLIRIHSKRYSQTPIIIQGPGAGKDVTAAGVLADVLKVAKQIK